jgi:hypothetical protein
MTDRERLLDELRPAAFAIAYSVRRAALVPGWSLRPVEVNGGPGAL